MKLLIIKESQLDWGEIRGVKVPIFYDAKIDLFEPFIEYGLAVAHQKKDGSEQAKISSLNNVAYHLNSFLKFLQYKKILWHKVDDRLLEEFKYWQEKNILTSPLNRTDRAAKRTTNEYLRTIYKFYTWAQYDAGLCSDIIGWSDYPIKSMLHLSKKNFTSRKLPSHNIYPILFRNVGEGSRHNYQYEATANDLDMLTEYFFSNFNIDVAERNVLIMLIANSVGWRQGSINSLTVDQFSDDKLLDSQTLFVKPAVQKFGYENSFEIKNFIAIQINKYIKTSRIGLLDKLKLSKPKTNNRLFLNTNTGQPLARKTITDIFSQAFNMIGAPKGAGIHSFRSKFTNDEINIEIAVRTRENRSTDPINIAFTMSKKLGQANIESQEAYSRAISRLTWHAVERQQDNRIKALEIEIANLKSKNKTNF